MPQKYLTFKVLSREVLLHLKNFIVEVVLKSLAVLQLLLLLLELLVRFGAGTTSCAGSLLLRLVPLLLLVSVHLSRYPRGQLHPWENGKMLSQKEGGTRATHARAYIKPTAKKFCYFTHMKL